MANSSDKFPKRGSDVDAETAVESYDDADNGREPTVQAGWGGAAPTVAGAGFFDIYKQGQGSNTRIWTGLTYGLLVCWGAYYIYEKFSLVGSGPLAKTIQASVVTVTLIGCGLLGYWALARNRRVCDFLIATEGEMKKVNWTSRKEIIGSTKVVIFLTIAMSVMLTVVDLVFMTFFGLIGVLKGPTILDTIRKLF